MDTATSPRSSSIVVEGDFPYAPEKVWLALTDARLIAEWLMPNDFQPERSGGNPEKRQGARRGTT